MAMMVFVSIILHSKISSYLIIKELPKEGFFPVELFQQSLPYLHCQNLSPLNLTNVSLRAIDVAEMQFHCIVHEQLVSKLGIISYIAPPLSPQTFHSCY